MLLARVGAHLPIPYLRSVSVYCFASLSNLYCFALFSLLCAEMDLFRVVRVEKPLEVTVGHRQLAEGEVPVLEATAGHTMDLVVEEPEDSPSVAQHAIPEQMIAPTEGPVLEPVEEPVQEPDVESRAASSSSVREVENPEVSMGKKMAASGGDDEGTSRKRRLISTGDSSEEAENSAAEPETEVVRTTPYG